MGNYPHSPGMAADAAVLAAQIVGVHDKSEAVDVSGTDHTATMTNCRFITCTAGTTIKLTYTQEVDGTPFTGTFPAEPRILPVQNVTKIFKTGTDAANIILHR